MVPVQNCVPAVLADLLRRQPLTPAKLALCWRLAVGPAVDRATRVALGQPGEILVTVDDPRWRREVERALPIVRHRLEYLLGPEAVSTVRVRGRDTTRG
jgi:hypothetical protein